MRDLAQKLDLSYEHVRRIARGENTPSAFVLKPICEILDMDFTEAERLAKSQRIRRRYGAVQVEFRDRVPGLQEVERLWGRLNETQRKDALTMMNGWVKNNNSRDK